MPDQKLPHNTIFFILTEEALCFTCGMVIRTESALSKHLKVLHNKTINRTPSQNPNDPFKCESCYKEFCQIEALRQHFRDDHKGLIQKEKKEKNHVCIQCSKTFHHKSQLENHINR